MHFFRNLNEDVLISDITKEFSYVLNIGLNFLAVERVPAFGEDDIGVVDKEVHDLELWGDGLVHE
jgi:hypothetical protein